MMNETRMISPPGVRRFAVWAAAAIGLLMLAVSHSSWGALSAHLERSTVQQGGTVTLDIKRDGTGSGGNPDLSVLHGDFQVLGTSTGTEINIVNGVRSDVTRWLVQLRPLHTGRIEIPPIRVGNERTPALELNVTAPSPQQASGAPQHVFVEAEAGAGSAVYVQQQIPYTVRLYYDGSVQSGNLAAPDPPDAVVEQLGKDEHYTTLRNGRQYNVIERHYAISPQRSGTLLIPPASFRGTVIGAQSSMGGFGAAGQFINRFMHMTPFANDPFFKGSFGASIGFGGAPQPVTAHSREITVAVQPRPAGARGSDWLPAESVTVHDSWADHPPHFKVGVPVTRTFTIEAKGASAAQIPPLSLPAPANARIYPEPAKRHSRSDGDAIYGVSKQSVTYIPSAKGTLRIAPVELDWWNTRSNSPMHVTLPARKFTVAAGAPIQPGAAPAAPVQAAQPAPARAARKPATAAPRAVIQHGERRASSWARWVRAQWAWFAAAAAVLAVIAVVALAAFGRGRPRAPQAPAAEPSPTQPPSRPDAGTAAPAPRKRSALRDLQQACTAGEGRAAAAALLELARIEWPENAPRGLGALAARLEQGAEEVTKLDRSLYAAGSPNWDGAGLWAVFRRGLPVRRGQPMQERGGLGALYR